MADSDYPWEPPFAGTEAEHLAGALDRLRTTFRWKAGALDAAGLQTHIGASTMTLGGLLKHLAAPEGYIFTTKLRGEPIGPPWDAPTGTARTTGISPPPPSNGLARGSTQPWPTAGSTSSSSVRARRSPRQPAPARL